MSFQSFIYKYYQTYGRHQLPWRQGYYPYQVLVSEIMLQQTQVDRVIPKFEAFLKKFPTLESLAESPQSEVLKMWTGLGYNRRALNLQKAAQQIVTQFQGQVPHTTEELLSLAGLGPYTTSAVQVFAFNQPAIVIETNVRTVYFHHFFPDQDQVHDQDIRPLVETTLDTNNPRTWYSALMDYGTYLKKLGLGPIKKSRHYTKQSTFSGSNRQMRGQILKLLTQQGKVGYDEIIEKLGDIDRATKALSQLKDEGFIDQKHQAYFLK